MNEKEQLVVTGEDIDTVCLGKLLKKKFCSVAVLTVEEVKKEGKKPKPSTISIVPFYPPSSFHSTNCHSDCKPSCLKSCTNCESLKCHGDCVRASSAMEVVSHVQVVGASSAMETVSHVSGVRASSAMEAVSHVSGVRASSAMDAVSHVSGVGAPSATVGVFLLRVSDRSVSGNVRRGSHVQDASLRFRVLVENLVVKFTFIFIYL
ncbi:hypothetical protein K1719_002130 [Acacia pycnantha]|nr:hypothetical protein K1719_002130 [Acacia pycnantha]